MTAPKKRACAAWFFAAAALLLPITAGMAQAGLPPGGQQTQLAGNNLPVYPYFEYVKAFNVDTPLRVAIDPFRFPSIVGETADIYVVEAKDAAQWASSPGLTDVAGGPLSINFSGASIEANRRVVAAANTLSADAGTGLGVGYDIVLDMNRNGLLDEVDYIDGLGNEAGLYMVHDTSQPGPLAVTEAIYSGGAWLGQDLYYPTNIGSMGLLPLVVISHGNGHNYQWYDHIGYHLASYGYIVMSHENNTGPGIETASMTTLTNTDYIIGNQGSIEGGVLSGHIDANAITWIGHSRGGEGITRAYDRVFDEFNTPENFTIDDIVLLSSMLPTDFLRTAGSNPHNANYHLWTASGDADVSGTASSDTSQTFHLHDRATAYRQSTVVQGTGHGWFHDGGGSGVFTGPCPIGETNTHLIQQGYFLPLVKHYVNGNIPAHDFLWRQYERFHPIGVDVTDPCIVVTHEYRNGDWAGNVFIDHFQSEPSTTVSSSGGAVTFTVQNLTEGRLDDNNSSFSWTASDPFNGATQCATQGASDNSAGLVFDWTGTDRYIEWEYIPSRGEFSDYRYLSFRAAQGTRHPNTLAVMGDLTFTVTLRDGSGTSSSINIGAYGGGLEQPFDRSSGWHNEMEVIRIRLTDFLNNGSGLDLDNVAAVRFDCGPSWGSDEGRIVVDELMLTDTTRSSKLITGPGPAQNNPTLVRAWDSTAPYSFLTEWPAYGVSRYGVNVAVGDLEGDGADEIITGPGPGAIFGPHVRAFRYSGSSVSPVTGVSFLAYGTQKFGVNVSAGDLDGDGYDEIVTGAGPGAVFGPHVRGWNVDGGSATAIPGISYLAYGTHKWGVNVACGDLDGDGYDEIVTGAGPGAVFGPHVRGWNTESGTAAAIPAVSFLAYGTNKFGVNVTCADLDGDGMAEIVTGPGPGAVFGPQVRGWNYDGDAVAPLSGVNFFAYPGVFYGVRVAAADVDGDGMDEILTIPGPDPAQPALVRAWNVDGGTATLITTIDFDAYGDLELTRGGTIAGGSF